MKTKSKRNFKFSFGILLICIVSLSFFCFNGKGEYTILDNGKVIKRGPGVLYQTGMINLKFRFDKSDFTKTSFNESKLDELLSKYSVTMIKQEHPLKANKSMRKIGDEELAKVFSVKYSSDIDPYELAEKVKYQNPDLIDWAEPSFVYECDYVPNDPLISSQWHISKINAFQAWDICKGDTTITIGIVDSGTQFDHPDLAANLKIRYSDPVNGIDDDGNGYIDDWRGWDFYYNDNDPSIMPNGNTHGSHVSGCASQVTDNGVHGAGIGFKTKVLLTKHTDDTNPESYLYYTDNGITYQYQNGAKVINCSYGSSSFSSYTQLIVNNAWANGTIICASAGNDGLNAPRYPASYDHVISVAATNSSDVKSSFSNYHTTVKISSPGESILSTVYPSSYASWDGTSMASPIVAGTVALMRAKYTSYTPQQIVDKLLSGVDSIYNLNPAYVGLLGSGRVNAFKCLSDLPIVKINAFAHNDSIYGNNDKIYEAGEIIPIKIDFKNTYIAGSNVSLRLTTSDTTVEIVQDSVYIGDVAAYGTFSTSWNNTFKVKAKSSCAFDKSVTFKVSGSATCYTDNSANTMSITFRQGYAKHDANNIKITLTRDGAIGKKAQSYGTGLQLGASTVNQIYESGLMIGVSDTKVSDVSRRGVAPANISDTDFVGLKAYTLTKPGIISAQDGNGKFNDDGAASNKIGVEVEQNSYEFTGPNDSNYIIFKYTIKNTNPTAISNLYAGIFSFFAPNAIFNSGNITRYYAASKLGYTYNTSTPNPYLGVALLTEDATNFKAMTSTDILNGFTTAEKWASLSGGIVNDSIGPGGNSFTLAAGPFNLAAGQQINVGFALIAGSSLNDLINKANIAKSKYTSSISVRNISTEVPSKFELMQNYPNPFNPSTTIKFALPKSEFVKIRVYDMLGKEVATLVNEQLQAGYFEYTFNASNLSSGLYFYKIDAGYYTDIKKMVLIK
jgi:hypothetical protein